MNGFRPTGSCGAQRQRGAVLILALLIVALVVTLAVNYASQMQLTQARTFNRLLGAQQDLYADSMVEMARTLLDEDLQDNQTDHLNEDWALSAGAGYSVEGGYIQGSLVDAQSYLNLNGLGNPLGRTADPLDPTRFNEAQRRFLRFLQTWDGNSSQSARQNPKPDQQPDPARQPDPAQQPDPEQPPLIIDLNLAVSILEALVDWLDADDEATGYGGAESLQYQQEDATWAPANGPMQSLQELRLVRHITPEIYQAISPYLVVLDSAAGLNINTLTQARLPILRALNARDTLAPLAAEDLAGYADWPGEEGFRSSDDLANHADFQPLLSAAGLDTAGLSVNTEHFWLNVEVQLDERVLNRRILLNRTGNGIKVLAQYSSGQATALQALVQTPAGQTGSAGQSDQYNKNQNPTDQQTQGSKP